MIDIDKIKELKTEVLEFLEHQKSHSIPGYFKYSYSGDLYDESYHWGLAPSCLAARLYYILDYGIEKQYKKLWVQFIKKYQNSSGEFFDEQMIKKIPIYRRILDKNCINKYIIGDTRQSWEALSYLGAIPDYSYFNLSNLALNWKKPWSAGSIMGHQIFFTHYNSELFNINNYLLIKNLLYKIKKYEKKDSWYLENPSNKEKIGAAMKICRAYNIINEKIPNPIDKVYMCLKENTEDACVIFNQIYIIYSCYKRTPLLHDEINKFLRNKLMNIFKYYHQKEGGFSFFPTKSNSKYYGVKISKGLNEPDIHGTAMFMWAIAIISEMLDWNKELKFKIPK